MQTVQQWIADFLSLPREKVHSTCQLTEDLRLDGPDAEEFIAAFAKRFAVSLASFRFERYFSAEPKDESFCYVADQFRDETLLPITIADLVRFAQAGEWVSPT